jgi:hypothetical protein
MAISFVAAGAVSTGISPTVAVPAGYAQGDLLIIVITTSAFPTTPTGWSAAPVVNNTLPRIYTYIKFATSSESSVVISGASASAAVMLAYRGVAKTNALSVLNTSTATSIATNTLTTTFANEYILSLYAESSASSGTWTAPASTTSRVSSSSNASTYGLLVVDELQATAGVSTARTATTAAFTSLAAISFSLAPVKNVYWVGGSGTWDTSSTTNWSTSSGGAGGAPVPTTNDAVVFDQAGTYTVTMTGALNCNNITVSAGTVTFATGTSPTLNISGSMSLIAGTVWNSTGNITFSSTVSGQVATTNNIAIAGSIAFNSSTYSLGSAITSSSTMRGTGILDTTSNNYAITAVSFIPDSPGYLKLNGSTCTLSGASPISGNLYLAGTSQINCTNSSAVISGNSTTFYNVALTSTTVGFKQISGGITFNNLTLANPSSPGVSVFQVFAGTNTINGTFTVSVGASAACRTFIQSTVVNTARTLTCASASFTDVDFRDISIAGAAAPVSGTRLGDCKGNSGITFPAAKTVYYGQTGSSSWGTAGSGSWALTSGGALDATAFPLAQDTAVFPAATYPASGSTTTLNNTYNLGTIDMSLRTTNTMTLNATGTSSVANYVYGNWVNGTGITLSGAGQISFGGRTTQQITSAGATFTQSFSLQSPGGTLTLQDALTTSTANNPALQNAGGTLDLNGKTLTLSNALGAIFIGSSTISCNLTFNGGTLVINGSGTAFFGNSSFTTTAGTGTGTISLTSASAKTFTGNNTTYNCTLNQGGAGALTITGANTFSNITNTYSATGATSILFTAATTSTFTNWNASGTAGKLLTISSATAATHTLSKASGTVSASYLSLTNSIATGGATWNAINSVNVSGNTGWIFATSSSGNFLMMFR